MLLSRALIALGCTCVVISILAHRVIPKEIQLNATTPTALDHPFVKDGYFLLSLEYGSLRSPTSLVFIPCLIVLVVSVIVAGKRKPKRPNDSGSGPSLKKPKTRDASTETDKQGDEGSEGEANCGCSSDEEVLPADMSPEPTETGEKSQVSCYLCHKLESINDPLVLQETELKSQNRTTRAAFLVCKACERLMRKVAFCRQTSDSQNSEVSLYNTQEQKLIKYIRKVIHWNSQLFGKVFSCGNHIPVVRKYDGSCDATLGLSLPDGPVYKVLFDADWGSHYTSIPFSIYSDKFVDGEWTQPDTENPNVSCQGHAIPSAGKVKLDVRNGSKIVRNFFMDITKGSDIAEGGENQAEDGVEDCKDNEVSDGVGDCKDNEAADGVGDCKDNEVADGVGDCKDNDVADGAGEGKENTGKAEEGAPILGRDLLTLLGFCSCEIVE